MILRYDQGMTTHTDTNVKIIENATRDDVRPGDHVTFESTYTMLGATFYERREGIAHHQDEAGGWRAEADALLTDGEGDGTTLTIRRPTQELPTKPGTVIVVNDGHEYVEAVVRGVVWRTREAVLGPDSRWRGVWRMDSGYVASSWSVRPEEITPWTWKVEGE